MEDLQLVTEILENYNRSDFKSIHNLLTENAQKVLSFPAMDNFFNSLYRTNGKMLGTTLIKNAGQEVICKVKFEKNNLMLTLNFDSRLKIDKILFAKADEAKKLPDMMTDTRYILPFTDKWLVLWGGDSGELNYHHYLPAQRYAFDFLVINNEELSHRFDGNRNEHYFAFGKDIFSPVDGIVESKVDGINDNQPGQTNKFYVPGNSIMIRSADNEYCFLAHFMLNSIKVNSGQEIKKGDSLGLCGNSGNSTEPHLHMHIQNSTDLSEGIGMKFSFYDINVNGTYHEKYSPVKSEMVLNQST